MEARSPTTPFSFSQHTHTHNFIQLYFGFLIWQYNQTSPFVYQIDTDRRPQDSKIVAAIPVKGKKLTDVKIGELPSRIRMWDFTPETLLERLKAVTTGSTTGMSSEKKKV